MQHIPLIPFYHHDNIYCKILNTTFKKIRLNPRFWGTVRIHSRYPSWRTTFVRLSATNSSVYPHLRYICGGSHHHPQSKDVPFGSGRDPLITCVSHRGVRPSSSLKLVCPARYRLPPQPVGWDRRRRMWRHSVLIGGHNLSRQMYTHLIHPTARLRSL